jgi:hypothetical protein
MPMTKYRPEQIVPLLRQIEVEIATQTWASPLPVAPSHSQTSLALKKESKPS